MASNDIIVRLRMLGSAAFTSAASGAAGAVRGIGDAADATAKKSGKLSGALDKAGGALGGIWTLAGHAGAGVAAAGVAAAGMGLKFDAGMEQSKVAFTNLLGGADEAQAMLDRLYKIAAKTPFEFPQLRDSTQRLLGFGMAAKDVVPTMTAVGDAVAAAGGGSDQIDKISTAMGQIQAKGKVSTEELMQMAESGVPAMKLLADQMGITGDELTTKLRKGLIDADTGISALVTGMNKKFGGMAEAQSKTFSGMISTLKDNAAQTLGAVMQPLFVYLEKSVLPAVQEVSTSISKWAKSGGVTSAINALKTGFTKGAGSATAGFTGMNSVLVKVGAIVSKVFQVARDAWNDFYQAIKPAMPFFQNVVLPLLIGIGKGVLGSVVAAFRVLIPIISIVARVLGWIGTKAAPLRGIIEKIGIVIGVIFGPAILRVIGMLGKLGGIFKIVAAAARIAAVPIRILGGIMKGLIGVVGRLFGKIGGVAVRAASALLKPFRGFATKFLEFGKAMIEGIANGIKSAPGVILNAIKSMLPGGKVGSLIRKAIPGLQSGGVVASRGVALVGESGPELVRMDAGARVYPLPSPAVSPIGAGATGGGGTITVPVHLDGRVIAEVVARRTADRSARR
jgi:tape measure domain-containing protein